MDNVLGVVHLKNLVGVPAEQNLDLRSIMRPAQRVPETLPASRLLKQFQATQQHLAMVVDEHGTVAGAVTLENVLEQIVGPLEYESDSELPDIVRDEPGRPLRRPANETNGFGGPTVGINAAILGPVRGVNGSRKHGHDPEPAMDLLDHAQILTVRMARQHPYWRNTWATRYHAPMQEAA